MFREEIRVNVVIIEHGKFIRLKYHCKQTGDAFWSFPSSRVKEGELEEEAAFRSVKEETNLGIHLLPYRLDIPAEEGDISKRYVTFIAYPEEGDINFGVNTDSEINEPLTIFDFRWQGINDDTELSKSEQIILRDVREYLKNGSFSHRVGALIYKMEQDQIQFLLFLKNKTKQTYTLPQGVILKNEFPESGAKRKGIEQMAVESEVKKGLGFYIFENKNKLIYTDIYLANFIAEIPTAKRINKKWCTVEEIEHLDLSREAKRCIMEVFPELNGNTAVTISDAERSIIQKFYDRKYKRNMALALMLIGAIVLSVGLNFQNLYVGTVLLVIGVIMDRIIWRCPVCNHPLPADGITKNMKYCYHCSTRLQ